MSDEEGGVKAVRQQLAEKRPDLECLWAGYIASDKPAVAIARDRRGRQALYPVAWCDTPGCRCVDVACLRPREGSELAARKRQAMLFSRGGTDE